MNLNYHIKKAFWRLDDQSHETLFFDEEKPFENEQVDFEDKRVNEAVRRDNANWIHQEYVGTCVNVTIEPGLGYAIYGLRNLVGPTVYYRHMLPSPVPILMSELLGFNRELDKAILFDGTLGNNYFHLISDVISKIYLLESFTEIDCPILVGQAVWNTAPFQYLIEHTELSKYNWQLIDKPVKVKKLWFARPMSFKKTFWLRTKSLFKLADNTGSEVSALFVNRLINRRISNFSAIETVLRKYHVAIIDPSKMSIQEQAIRFNSANRIVGIHGAGLANLVFCNNKGTKVLEVCANNQIRTQYYWLCTTLGIDWDVLLGEKADENQSFELNAEEFEKRLIEFLAS